ncbi:hypothetical protein ACJRO7_016804 [Eucalyptus globulus]|uniref:CN hydrolase domain-containing protein n=1 Tax=Eucalyptus globulus TaxID=34317 RepID=A0ABD3KU87_EUCGL
MADKAERLLAEAASHGSQLVVFPEAFAGGCVIIGNRTAKGREEFRKYHASAIDVPDGYTLYCTILFFDPQGRYLGKHRKVMPTALERVIWGFGDGLTIPVFDTPIGKIGVEIYCAPTADARDTWQASTTHIALEGGYYPPPPEYVFAGTDDDLNPNSVVCAGGSVIISPSGNVLAGPNYDGEALISADLDLEEIARAKFDFDVVGHYSRPEVVSLTVRDNPSNPVTFALTSGKPEGPYK